MVIDARKIKAVIEYYGQIKNYPEKSYITKFCEDFKLNYKQWSALCSGNLPGGYKVVDIFLDIFPNIDTNWLIKNDVPVNGDKFLSSGKIEKKSAKELNEEYTREITNDQLFRKMEEIQFEFRKFSEKK